MKIFISCVEVEKLSKFRRKTVRQFGQGIESAPPPCINANADICLFTSLSSLHCAPFFPAKNISTQSEYIYDKVTQFGAEHGPFVRW